ncbi:MAG: hypothetical protein ACRD22_05710 [Terriglobia bacterium]
MSHKRASAAFGVVILPRDSGPVEVATYRSDGVYADGRHPVQVRYATTAREDVLRCDSIFRSIRMCFHPFRSCAPSFYT